VYPRPLHRSAPGQTVDEVDQHEESDKTVLAIRLWGVKKSRLRANPAQEQTKAASALILSIFLLKIRQGMLNSRLINPAAANLIKRMERYR